MAGLLGDPLLRLAELFQLLGDLPLALDRDDARLGVLDEEAAGEALDEGLEVVDVGAAADPAPGLGVGLAAGEVELVRQRPRDLRNLLAAGLAADLGRNPPEDLPDLDAGRLDLPEQGGGEEAVAAVAVERDLVRGRRVGDHHVAARVEFREARPDGAARPRAAQRQVAARVEDQDPDARRPVERLEQLVDVERLVIEADLVLELRVDRDEVVLAAVLKAVPGVKDQRGVRRPGGPGEILELAPASRGASGRARRSPGSRGA